MKIILIHCFFMSSALNLCAQFFLSSQFSEDITDPITNDHFCSYAFSLTSNDDSFVTNQNYRINVIFIKKISINESIYNLRLVSRTNLNEWPLGEKAYLRINGELQPLTLQDVRSKPYSIEQKSSHQDTSGVVIEEVSTKDFYLIRKEATLPMINDNLENIETVSLILYWGEIPSIFELDHQEVINFNKLLQYKRS